MEGMFSASPPQILGEARPLHLGRQCQPLESSQSICLQFRTCTVSDQSLTSNSYNDCRTGIARAACQDSWSMLTHAEVEASAKNGRRDPDTHNACKVVARGPLGVAYRGYLHGTMMMWVQMHHFI